MDRTFQVGVGLAVLGVAGYVAGVVAPYPGRAFAITALMVGITLVAVSDSGGEGS